MQITGDGCTYCGSDQDYYDAIDAISAASGFDLSTLKKGDPWGVQRYLINENEGEDSGNPCIRDRIWVAGNREGMQEIDIPFYRASC